MNVAGRHNGLSEFLTQRHNPPVHVHNILPAVNGGYFFRGNHKLIVSHRLDFQIIVKIYNPCDFRIRLSVQKRPVKLPGLAGAP